MESTGLTTNGADLMPNMRIPTKARLILLARSPWVERTPPANALPSGVAVLGVQDWFGRFVVVS
jgi:hypothetical protein